MTVLKLNTATAPDQDSATPSRAILVPLSSVHFIHGADDDVPNTLVYMMLNGEPLCVKESLDDILDQIEA